MKRAYFTKWKHDRNKIINMRVPLWIASTSVRRNFFAFRNFDYQKTYLYCRKSMGNFFGIILVNKPICLTFNS